MQVLNLPLRLHALGDVTDDSLPARLALPHDRRTDDFHVNHGVVQADEFHPSERVGLAFFLVSSDALTHLWPEVWVGKS